jgi:hypothetical protein
LRECMKETDEKCKSEDEESAKARKKEREVVRNILDKKEEFSQNVLSLLSDVVRYDGVIDNLLGALVDGIDEKRLKSFSEKKKL